jgi:hypothetical protein
MIKLKDLLNEVKFKSPDYIISTTPASSLPAQKLGHADVSVGLKMAEKLKNYTLHVRHYKLVHADGKVALKLTPEGKTAVRVRTEDDPKYLQLIQKTVNDVVADFVSKIKESVNEALDPKAEKFLDAIQVNDRSIKDLKNITVDATPQGNWSVYYKGKRMFTLNGKMLDDKTIMKYGLEHMDESLSEGKYYVTYNRGRGQGKGLEKEFDQKSFSSTDKPKVFNSYNDAKKYAEKMEKMFQHSIGGGVAYWVSDEKMNPIKESVNEDKVYIDFLNKKKGFKQDRIKFNSYEDAVKWAKKNFDKFDPDMIKYESVNEDAPIYKDWDEFVNPHYILVTLKNGKKLKIEKKNVKGGTNIYHAILKAFNDNNHKITNKVVSGMIDRLGESVNEAQAKYDVYHNSYTSAIQSAKEYAEKNGYTVSDDDSFRKIGMGPRKPSEGKTNSFSIELSYGGKDSRKQLHIQVYGMRNKYELNCYIG